MHAGLIASGLIFTIACSSSGEDGGVMGSAGTAALGGAPSGGAVGLGGNAGSAKGESGAPNGAGGASIGGAGTGASSPGGSPSIGGAPGGSGGEANGGNPANGGSGASAAGGTPGAGGTDCDPRHVQCRMAEPPCPQGEVPSVDGSCYGPCVPIGECGCTEPEACPHPEEFTCVRINLRCSYYLR